MAIAFQGAYFQNFDSLATNGMNHPWANDSTLPGWYLFRQPAPGIAIPTYDANTGSNHKGTFYSYGLNGASDRALGGLGSEGDYFGKPATGKIAGWIAFAATNTTGLPINNITLNFDGEQWRSGANTTPQTMVLEYGIGATFDTVSTWTTPGGNFDFTSPVSEATGVAVNGNMEGSLANLGGTIHDLTWENNQTIWIRWVNLNDEGHDHGLAIDNFSLVWYSAIITESESITNLTEGGATDTYTVVLSNPPTAEVTITINPDPQTTTGVNSLIFTTENWDDPQTVEIVAVDDNIVEGNHTGTITHTAISTDPNYDGISINPVTANITDNDSANNPPVVGNAIADLTATVSTLFNFTFPSDTFTDPDGNPLSYSATLEDGSDLPHWLLFDTTTRTFSGTPIETHVGSLNIKVTASDGSLSVSDIFTLAVSAVTPNSEVEGEDSTESEENTPESEENTPESEENTPESDENTPESDNNTPESQENTPESEENTPESDENTPESEANNLELEENTPESEANNLELEENTPESDENTPESEANNLELEENTPESDENTPESDENTPELEANNLESEANNLELEANNPESDENLPESEANNPELDENIPELEANNLELEANNLELEANNLELDENTPDSEANNPEFDENVLAITDIGNLHFQIFGPIGPSYFKEFLANAGVTSSIEVNLSKIFEWIYTLEELSPCPLSSSNLSQLEFHGEGNSTYNLLMGTPESEFIHAGLGDNFIQGLSGDDSLFGGEGNDIIHGNLGDDFIKAGAGNNWIYGGKGEDTLVGGSGIDVLYGNDGNDLIYAGCGNNFIYGNQGNDTLIGGEGNDVLYGGKGDDLLIGGDGDDWLFGDLGNDILMGGAGQDRFIIRKGAGVDLIVDFTEGEDLIGLAEGLTFSDLTLTQENNSTLIYAGDELLAILNSVDVSGINQQDFFRVE